MIVFAASLHKTCSLPCTWPLAQAKFASVFLIFASVWLSVAISSRVQCTRLATSTICMPLAATRVQFACDWWPFRYNLYVKARCPNSYLNKKMKTPLKSENLLYILLARAYPSTLAMAWSNLMRQLLGFLDMTILLMSQNHFLPYRIGNLTLWSSHSYTKRMHTIMDTLLNVKRKYMKECKLIPQNKNRDDLYKSIRTQRKVEGIYAYFYEAYSPYTLIFIPKSFHFYFLWIRAERADISSLKGAFWLM
jgi:hypothetical protein